MGKALYDSAGIPHLRLMGIASMRRLWLLWVLAGCTTTDSERRVGEPAQLEAELNSRFATVRMNFDIDDKALGDVVDVLRAVTNTGLVVDWSSVDPKSRVTYRATAVPLDLALREILQPLGLVWAVIDVTNGGESKVAIVITTPERAAAGVLRPSR